MLTHYNRKTEYHTSRLTVSSLHQLGVAVLRRLFLSGSAGALGPLHLDPIGAGGVVSVSRDIRGGRMVLWVREKSLVSSPLHVYHSRLV